MLFLVHHRPIEVIVHSAEPEDDVDFVDRREVAGVGAAMLTIVDPVGFEVRTDVEEEPVDIQLLAKLLIESKHINECAVRIFE